MQSLFRCFALVSMTGFALLLFASSAFATDGVLEINQTCAVQTGCFAGDAAGYPVTITEPGTSYVLTSSLIVPDENTNGIVVNTSSVSIDLNGFEISGPVTCSSISPGEIGMNCTPGQGVGSGVVTEPTLSGINALSVKNGSITGMGRWGILFSGFQNSQHEVTNLRVRWNPRGGINVADGSTVLGNTVYQNGVDGIAAGYGSTVSGNTAYQNGRYGILTFDGSTISGNTAYQNGEDGIFGNNGSTISGNTAHQNAGDGIDGGYGSTIIGNTAHDNGDEPNPTLADGIECSFGCLVRENSVMGNSGYGLNVFDNAAYSDNVVTYNSVGAVTGGGSANNLGGNYCAGTGVTSSSCP